ncbi:NUDIX hydrolase [Micromonospora sp. BQ11]|uniref:NUDIX hydrolase n=1 Tax=Micromonospora sp. BQ11 TaxID=3452212 RepID=UPI003F8B3AB8
MAVPEYIRRMRRHIGTELLWLPSVSAVVRNDAGDLLLGQRADDGRWSVVSGIVEPGEQPATAVVREVREETGLEVEPARLSSVLAHPHTYPNGDRCEFLNLGFLCHLVDGTARVNDDESVAVGWFPPDALPTLDRHARLVIAHALGISEKVLEAGEQPPAPAAPDAAGPAWFLPAGTAWSESPED